MKKTVLLCALTSAVLFGKSLVVDQGVVKAHTEVFGDSNINPQTTAIISHLKMQKSIASMRGSIDVNVFKLKSSNHKRDEHMVKAIESTKYPRAHYVISKVQKSGGGYLIYGNLTFHGVTRPLVFAADINKVGNKVNINASSYIKLSDYKVKPIKLLFLSVRDKIDLTVNVTLK